MNTKKIEQKYFEEPPVEFRPVPFWGLTKTLKEEELLGQIEEMKRKGWGGFFMHARYPLETPYLADEYMHLMNECVKKAEKEGLNAWIYDDHPWCSGSAGGLTAAVKKEYRSKALVLNMHHRLTPIDPEEAMGYYALLLDDNGVPVGVKEIPDPEHYHGNEHYFLHFYLFTEPLHAHYEPGFFDDCVVHGFPSADNLNPRAVQRYIDVTYERFRETVGEERFGTTLMGGFSDMPTYNWNYSTPHPSIPWTTGFETYFREKYGYDILPHLPSLFFDVGEQKEKIRCDYWKAVSALFAETFTKQLYDWAARHHCIYSGHYWGEETLHWQIPWCGDVMQHFMYQQYVGMDHSVKTIEDPAGIIQAATAAEQLGKPRMIAESYGLSGNGLSHKQRKWIADWEYALGANFLIPYIAQSSLKGRAKRDEPASIFIQQPYWPYEKPLYDYYGRLSYVLTRGRRVVNLLLMQPLETARTMYTANKYVSHCYRPDDTIFESANAKLYDYNQDWMTLVDRLLAMHRDFHIGNEVLMERFGHVNGSRLAVGECEYPLVIVPQSVSWAESTVKLLREFAANGGTIIAINPGPTMIGGVLSGSVLPPGTIFIDDDPKVLEKAIDDVCEKDIVMDNCSDLLYHHRKCDAEDIYFITNNSLTETYKNVKIKLPGAGYMQVWDAFNGKKYRLPADYTDGFIEFTLDFYPVTSFLLAKTEQEDLTLPVYQTFPEESQAKQILCLNGCWNLQTDDPNVLVLDYADIKIGKTGWREHLPVHQIQQVSSQAGIGSRYQLRYSFTVRDIPETLSLVMEMPERTAVTVNGQPVNTADTGWWIDPSFRTLDITALVRQGKNTLEISGIVGVDTELEACMLIGDMAVWPVREASEPENSEPENSELENSYPENSYPEKQGIIRDFVIAGHVTESDGRDITNDGYPFFTGSIKFRQEVELDRLPEQAFLKLDAVDSTLARIRVNGECAGFLPWEPFRTDVTRFLHTGTNQIEIELITTRRNLFGPHHYKFRDQETFSVPGRWINEAYWMDDYYFAPLGISGAELCLC